MALMRLKTFFERFDRTRDGLRRVLREVSGKLPRRSFDSLDEGEIQIIRDYISCKKILLGSYFETRYLVGVASSVEFPAFQSRKGEVSVYKCLGVCYVPDKLANDLDIAEMLFEKYLGGDK